MIRLNTYVTTVPLHFTLFRDLFKTCKGNDRTIRETGNIACGKKRVRMYLVTLSHTACTNNFDIEK
jgi:hypothetical protein